MVEASPRTGGTVDARADVVKSTQRPSFVGLPEADHSSPVKLGRSGVAGPEVESGRRPSVACLREAFEQTGIFGTPKASPPPPPRRPRDPWEEEQARKEA